MRIDSSLYGVDLKYAFDADENGLRASGGRDDCFVLLSHQSKYKIIQGCFSG